MPRPEKEIHLKWSHVPPVASVNWLLILPPKMAEKHPADPPVKPSKPGRYRRFKQNIRISLNMLRAVYYVGRTGISHGSPDLYWKTVLTIATMTLMELFYWIMSKRISGFYGMVSNVAANPESNFYWFLAQFALAAVGYAAVSI